MKVTLKLMRVGMSMQEATIAEWFKRPGDQIAEGESLYAIETDKVTQEVVSPGTGVLLDILAEEGQDVPVGAPVCIVDFQA